MLLSTVQILTTLLVAVAMALSLAHALELPGKLRLSQEAYCAMQPIYYPGFTIGGAIGETVGTVATIVLLFLVPTGTAAFWLTVVALLGLLGMQGVYWLVTHPVNKFWLRDQALGGFGAGFFAFGQARRENRPASWTELRDRWEYSHVARAGFAFVSLAALITALSLE